MKRLTLYFLLLFIVISSCKKEDNDGIPPVLPPAETMVIDFNKFTNTEKSAVPQRMNWIYAATNVGIWNVLIGTTFAVPVASFKLAVNNEPVKTGNYTWQWQYEVDGFTSSYTARLTGTLEVDEVRWEMYISKEGIDSFDEFMWFEGISKTDGRSGWWLLYHSPMYQEETVRIDWKKEDVEVGDIKYTYVRELNNTGQPDPFNGSSLHYGLKQGLFDAWVHAHTWDQAKQVFNDTQIEWSRTKFNGWVKSPQFYGDTNWHCWDEQGYDIECD